MQWTKYVCLVHRVYVRQIEDTSSRFNEMEQQLKTLWMHKEGRIELGPIEEDWWPVSPTDLEKAKQRGLLITDNDGNAMLVMRERQIKVRADEANANEIVKQLLECCGDVFAVIQIVSEALTEVQAV